jgi:hypothetical protein
MLKTVLFFLGLIVSIHLNAQIPDSAICKSKYIKSFKLNFGYKHYTDFDIIDNVIDRSNPGSPPWPHSYFKNIGIGLLLKSRKTFNTHELEIGNFQWYKYFNSLQADSSSQHGNYGNAAFRYEYNYFFLKKASRLSPYLGADILIGFAGDRRSVSKLQSNLYSSTDRTLGVQMSIVPGIQFLLSNRVYFDFSIPSTLLRISRFYFKEYSQFSIRSNDLLSVFRKEYLQLRLAIGVYLENVSNKKEFKTEKYIKTVKLNSNLYFGYSYQNSFEFSGLAPVLTFQNKKNFEMHEIEFSQFSVDRNHFRSATYVRATNLNMRYQFNYFFIKREKKLVSPYIGSSYTLSSYKSKSVNKIYPDNDYSELVLSSGLHIAPGIQFYPSPRLYLDLSIPLQVLTIQTVINKMPTPYNAYYYKFFPAFSYKELYFRFGVGYRI